MAIQLCFQVPCVAIMNACQITFVYTCYLLGSRWAGCLYPRLSISPSILTNIIVLYVLCWFSILVFPWCRFVMWSRQHTRSGSLLWTHGLSWNREGRSLSLSLSSSHPYTHTHTHRAHTVAWLAGLSVHKILSIYFQIHVAYDSFSYTKPHLVGNCRIIYLTSPWEEEPKVHEAGSMLRY